LGMRPKVIFWIGWPVAEFMMVVMILIGGWITMGAPVCPWRRSINPYSASAQVATAPLRHSRPFDGHQPFLTICHSLHVCGSLRLKSRKSEKQAQRANALGAVTDAFLCDPTCAAMIRVQREFH
jgi:hypothetical protein